MRLLPRITVYQWHLSIPHHTITLESFPLQKGISLKPSFPVNAVPTFLLLRVPKENDAVVL